MLGFTTMSQKSCVEGHHDSGKRIFLKCSLDRIHTRVVCRTLTRRGKSFTPESRIEMLEESRVLLDRREETQDASAFAMM